MEKRNIGKSGLSAPFLGMGTWAIGGGSWWGDNDDALSVKAVLTAVEQGITWVDTAPIYGLYHSEEVVGEALKHLDRDKIILSTKCGLEWRHQSPVLHKVVDGVQVYRDLSEKSILEDVEESLKRLGTDHIDVLYTHWQSPDFSIFPLEETVSALMKLKAQGKIRAIGASNMTADLIRGYCRYGQLDVIQEKYSLLTRRVEKQLLPTCKELGVSVQAYSPLEQGLLTGKVTMDTTYPEGSTRNTNPCFPACPPEAGAGPAGQVGRPDREIRLHHGAAGHCPDRQHGAGPVRAVRCPHSAAGDGQRRCAEHQAGRCRCRPHEVGRGRDLLTFSTAKSGCRITRGIHFLLIFTDFPARTGRRWTGTAARG